VTDPDESATRRYKDIMAEVTTAADQLRRDDLRRATQLREELIGLEDEMLRTGERARLSASVVQLHWEAALDLLWAESWMNLRRRPAPDPTADPTRLEAYDEEVRRRADALHAAVRRRWYHLRR
jgi:hypothetical protein